MRLYFLGTSGYHPTRRRDTACLMIPERGVVLDAGSGFFRARELLQTEDLHIFLTHTHLDHVMGLTFLLDVVHQKPVKNVYVYCDPQKKKAISEHLYHPEIFPVAPTFEFRDLEIGPHALPGGGTLTAFKLEHPGGCLGFRLEWPGSSMGYVTDTTADLQADYVKRIHGVELLVHECYFADGAEEYARITGHSCATPVARVAAEAKSKRLALIHMNPLDDNESKIDLAQLKTVFPNVIVPSDDDFIEF